MGVASRRLREIAAILAEQGQVHVAASSVVRFVIRRCRREKEGPPSSVQTVATVGNEKVVKAPMINGPADDIRQPIEEFKRPPVPAEPPHKLFHDDEDKPLTLVVKTEKK